MNYTILITGSKGQLGNEIQQLAKKFPDYNFIFHDIDTLDVVDLKQLEHFYITHRPAITINCAAYTAVDKAESEPEKAYLINADAVNNLCQMAEENNSWLIHISTDYVFDGMHNIPYKESDYTNPLSVYGKSKLAGEQLIADYEKAIIIRTSWLYSTFGNNIVKTIMRLATEREQIRFVYDQIGSPTYAADLANAITKIISVIFEDLNNTEISGIYHFANEGACSWYDFASTIIEIKNLKCSVEPIETWEYPTPAKRPAYSVLNKNKIKTTFGIDIPWWKKSLEQCLSKF